VEREPAIIGTSNGNRSTRGDGAGVIKRGIDLLRRPELNKSIAFTETCPTCGGPLTQGECLRCLVSLGFLSDSQQPEKSQTGRRLTPGQLKYDHFEVEVGADGFPVELGAGAMAITYRARDTVLNSTVALKVIDRKVAQTPGVRSRFLREARAAAHIHHPNVARVSHYGEQDGECFYVMELVEGETLEAKVRREGPMPLALALEVIEQTARALAAAEACGVVHRDIKPSNIMLESDPSGTPIVKVIDYGIAKILDPEAERGAEQTQTGFIGTPAFASPEQFTPSEQTKIDTRSDIYSLGATLWYLLSGRVPFVGRTLREVAAKQAEELPLEQLKNTHVPARVIALLQSMLAVDPAKRPQTARELLSAIHRCYTKFSVEARARKRRATLTVAGVALIVAAITAGAWMYQRAQSSAEIERSIAVLPFENRSEDKANAYFAEGIQDEILTRLSKIADLKVISRTSTQHYKSAPENLAEIGKQLGVAHILEGSVQRSGDGVRVNVQLIKAANDSHLWGDTFDRKLTDIFSVESEVAKAIADQLQAKLSPNEKKAIEQPPTTDLAAFDLYSRAKSLLLAERFSATGEPDLRKAIELLDETVKRDPSFFEAYCQLAYAHEELYAVWGSDHTPARLALAEAALQAVTRLRPDAAETHLARAQYLYYGLRDYAGALAELEIARRALPNDPRLFELTGFILRRRGQQEEGLQNLQRAVELDPRNFLTLQQIAVSYQYLGRYAEAIAALDRALAIAPDNVETRANLAEYELFWKADTRPLHQTIDAILAQGPGAIVRAASSWFDCALAERDPAAAERALVALGDNPCWGEDAIILSRSFGEGLLARMTKDEARAHTAFEAARAQQEKIVQAQPDYGPALCVLGLIDAALWRKDLALDEGRRAIALTPVEKDVSNGSRVLQYFAITAAWAGDKELALQQLEAGLRAPNAAVMLSYGALKLFPVWDPLRGDPRFEKIVTSLAPKPTDK
jgi:serine/threonine protein kinase